jgi:hypothetical protein
VRRGKVRYVGIADRTLLRRASTLIRYHKRAGFATSRKKSRR